MPAAPKNNPAADTAKMNLFIFIDTPMILPACSNVGRQALAAAIGRCNNSKHSAKYIFVKNIAPRFG
jgi:hypothetical protein